MTLETIAHYKITSKLGEGGMGEVCRATDTKLNREVAIKVIPDSFAEDPDRMTRFTREAQVLASLNHPNIAVVHPADFDGDGRPDRARISDDGKIHVQLNRARSASRWIRVQLQGVKSLKLGQDAEVEIKAGNLELFYVSGSDARIMMAGYTVKDNSFAADKPRTWSPAPIPRSGILSSYDLAPDGKRFVTFQVPGDQQDEKGSVHVTVLLNFFDELRRRMP